MNPSLWLLPTRFARLPRSLRSLGTVVACGLVLYGCRGGDSDKPPVHFIPNMDTQEKGRAYRKDTSGLFADGRVMRLPVEGTVAVGHLDDDDLMYEGTAPGPDGGTPGPSQKFPASVAFNDDPVKDYGKLRYDIYCAPCHGVNLDGKGPVALKGGLMVPPPSLLDARIKGFVVGKLYAAIKNGVNNGNMPSYAAQIPVEDRWAIIAYIRKIQGVPPESGEGVVVVEAATTSSVKHGEQLYRAKGCNACHTLDGNKLVGPTWKGAYGKKEKLTDGTEVTVDDAYIKESIEKPNAKIVEGYPPAMPVLPLSDIEIGSLTLFIKAQQ